jgi:hypothetical protein
LAAPSARPRGSLSLWSRGPDGHVVHGTRPDAFGGALLGRGGGDRGGAFEISICQASWRFWGAGVEISICQARAPVRRTKARPDLAITCSTTDTRRGRQTPQVSSTPTPPSTTWRGWPGWKPRPGEGPPKGGDFYPVLPGLPGRPRLKRPTQRDPTQTRSHLNNTTASNAPAGHRRGGRRISCPTNSTPQFLSGAPPAERHQRRAAPSGLRGAADLPWARRLPRVAWARAVLPHSLGARDDTSGGHQVEV